jgi:hypothetical protein
VERTASRSPGDCSLKKWSGIGAQRYPVIRGKAKQLRRVAFALNGDTIMGIEQNPATKSRWAQLARSGDKVMQFIQDGRYIAAVADGKVTLYGKTGHDL